MHSAIPRAALYGVFMLSGAAGLAYQAVWSRLFTNGLGHEMPAVLAIMASFFAGLTAGAWTLDRGIARSGRPWKGSRDPSREIEKSWALCTAPTRSVRLWVFAPRRFS